MRIRQGSGIENELSSDVFIKNQDGSESCIDCLTEETARLFAAAPELLAALETALEYIPDGFEVDHQARESIKKTIEKARGVSK